MTASDASGARLTVARFEFVQVQWNDYEVGAIRNDTTRVVPGELFMVSQE